MKVCGTYSQPSSSFIFLKHAWSHQLTFRGLLRIRSWCSFCEIQSRVRHTVNTCHISKEVVKNESVRHAKKGNFNWSRFTAWIQELLSVKVTLKVQQCQSKTNFWIIPRWPYLCNKDVNSTNRSNSDQGRRQRGDSGARPFHVWSPGCCTHPILYY